MRQGAIGEMGHGQDTVMCLQKSRGAKGKRVQMRDSKKARRTESKDVSQRAKNMQMGQKTGKQNKCRNLNI